MTVTVESRYYPNLVAHAFGVMGLANSYRDYVPDLDTLGTRFHATAQGLLSQGSDFGFRAPLAGGPMFTFIYQLPSDLNVRSQEEISETFALSVESVKQSCLEPFFAKYPVKRCFWEPFYAELPMMLGGRQGEKSNEQEARVRFVSSFRDFLFCLVEDHFESLWSDWDIRLSERARQLENLMIPMNIARHWENHLNLRYPFNSFAVLLSVPDRTSASSVGPEAIVVSERLSDGDIVASALHEIGVRMFFATPVLAEAWRNITDLKAYEHLLLCCEAACCAEKAAVARDLGMESIIENDRFVESMKLRPLMEAWHRIEGRSISERFRAFCESTERD